MGWCNDVSNKKYNKLIKINKNLKHEKMFRNDYKYDYVLPINYNSKNIQIGKGSAIFIHITKNYIPTKINSIAIIVLLEIFSSKINMPKIIANIGIK